MTTYLIDLASPYQDNTRLQPVWDAGFTWANVKTSEGIGYLNPNRHVFADRAKAVGMHVSSFHYLRNGNAVKQAQIAYSEHLAIGAEFHQCDNEADADWATTRDYINAFQQLLGRHVIFYTGDWWLAPKGWNVAPLTPYLWAAPNDGYPGTYRGDSHRDWTAGYGGFKSLAAQQFAVKPVPGAGGQDLSMTAFRDTSVLSALTGVDMALTDDDISRIWSFGVGKNKRPAHFALSDAADMLNDGASSYDGRVGVVPALVKAIMVELGNIGTIELATLDVDAIATAVADKIYGRMQS